LFADLRGLELAANARDNHFLELLGGLRQSGRSGQRKRPHSERGYRGSRRLVRPNKGAERHRAAPRIAVHLIPPVNQKSLIVLASQHLNALLIACQSTGLLRTAR
jgi:hypothetical protein